MITPLNQTSLTYSSSRLSTRTAPEKEPHSPNDASLAKLSTNETRVELHSSTSFFSTNNTYPEPSTYSVPGSTVKTGASNTTEVAAPQTVDPATAPVNPYADTILSFIDLQLTRDVADGATQDELQSRLQAGLDGFMQGYGEAFDQLSASGILDDETKAAIQQTYSQVLDGVTAMAEKLGLDNPVKESDRLPVAPPVTDDSATDTAPVMIADGLEAFQVPQLQADDQLNLDIIQQFQQLQSSLAFDEELSTSAKNNSAEAVGRLKGYGYSVKATNDFNFTLQTSEGDKVNVSISASKTGDSQLSEDDLVLSGQQNSAFSFSVTGDLDSDELQAINELLSKVGDISSSFFDGNFSQAFDLASNLSLSGDQIQSFALNLKMTQSERSSATSDVYSPKQVERSAERNQLKGLANMLDSAGVMVEKLKLPSSFLSDLLDYVNSITQPDDPNSTVPGSIAQEYLAR